MAPNLNEFLGVLMMVTSATSLIVGFRWFILKWDSDVTETNQVMSQEQTTQKV